MKAGDKVRMVSWEEAQRMGFDRENINDLYVQKYGGQTHIVSFIDEDEAVHLIDAGSVDKKHLSILRKLNTMELREKEFEI